MKKVHFFTITALLATFVAILLFSPSDLITPGIICTAAFILILLDITKFTSLFQSIALVLVSLVFGYMFKVPGGFPFLISSFLLITMGLTLRFTLMDFSYSYLKWLEPLLAIVALVFYLLSNIHHSLGWEKWVFPGVTIATGSVVVFINYFDNTAVTKLSRGAYVEIGAPAPEFTLKDMEQNTVNLSDFKGQNLLLIFVRGDWCPGCHIMLRTYEKERVRFQNKGITVMAIGPDPVGVNLEMVKKLGLNYKVLSDERQETARKYSVQLQGNHPHTKFQEGIPLPASFLIDKEGKVRYTSRADRAGEILNPSMIFPIVEALS